MPNGVEGERRDLGATAPLKQGQAPEEVAAEVERLWRTESLGTGVVVGVIEEGGDASLSTSIDGLHVTATATSGQLTLEATSACLPRNVLEPVRGDDR